MAKYSDSAAWKNSNDAIDRVAIAVFFYARYILGEDPVTPLHSVRVNWAKNAFQNPGAVSSGLLTAVSMDGNIAAVLPGVPTDQQIQTATETAINQILNF